ncbi:GroES-like protein [Colletotrichum zoysiae]|uniref:GroES-like protein n=1 Tax=Colletotrichum zoysiae TaxID=1216348 RepID=A0AAD9H3G1_9PEZI|nr:GroES-like protein [Colletotrichum zoysiae]
MNEMMRGVVFNGRPFDINIQNIPRPAILNETDAIVRITTSAVCGSDLHIYRGVMGGTPPWTMGHEAIGYISAIGDAVSSLSVGDYVVVPDTVSPGHLEMEPAAMEYFAEYAKIPFADANLIPIPLTHETTNSTVEQDYLTVSDIFATGWAGIDYSGFEVGDCVAVFGAGPVGLLSAYSAILRGASRVYVVDHVEQRLHLAASIGAVPVNFAKVDPVSHILSHEPAGVMRSVDCVGMEALNAELEREEGIVIRQMVDVTHFGGGIGQLGVFKSQSKSPGAPHADTISPTVPFPISTFFGKALSFRSGAVDPKTYAPVLIDLISSGKARPGFVVSAAIGIEEAAVYYERFYQKLEAKVVIHFPR